MTENYLRPNATPDDLLRIARNRDIPLTRREAEMVAFGVYERGSVHWNEREYIRARLGNSCIAIGRLHDAPRLWRTGNGQK